MAHTKEQARCAKVPWAGPISGSLYARCDRLYWSTCSDSKEWSPIPLASHTSSMYGQYQSPGLQDSILTANGPIARRAHLGHLRCFSIRHRCRLRTGTYMADMSASRIYVEEIHGSST